MAELKQSLGFWPILALSITSILGTGVFFGAGISSRVAGNMILVSWAVLSVVAIYISLNFAELSSMFPSSGGVYEYGKQAYGRLVSFIIGWLAWLSGSIGAIVLIVAAVESLLPGNELFIFKIAISILFIAFLNLIAFMGIEASAMTSLTFAAVTIVLILAVILRGVVNVDFSNFVPFFLYDSFRADLLPILAATFLLFESFFGWESVTFLSEETRNPRKVIPTAIVLGTVLVAVLGFLVFFVMLGVIPHDVLARSTDPLNDATPVLFGNAGRDIINLSKYLVLIGGAAASIFTLPRLLLALARDKLFPGQTRAIHPKYRTPYKAIMFQAVVLIIILLMSFGNYAKLIGMLVPLGLILYILVLLSVPVLRIRQPRAERPFRAPLGMLGPVLISAFLVLVIVMWLINQPGAVNLLLLSGSFVLLGFPIYMLMAVYHDPKMIVAINEALSSLYIITERFTLPKSVLKEMIRLLGDVSGKKVLEFGSGVGTITIPLARKVGPNGIVYATSFSKKGLKITQQRVEGKAWKSLEREYASVRILHDVHHTRRVHPYVRHADAVVSMGMLGYIQDADAVLQDLAEVLPENGRIVFMEYADYFHFLPNPVWLDSSLDIEKKFRSHGFAVRVERRKGLLWNYVLIYGFKTKADVAVI
ncbi:amino acid permease [Candidatus Woesearchaeota archaeon]|nr:amino acid permease [Candidatus Woesearchaeota archaeon]